MRSDFDVAACVNAVLERSWQDGRFHPYNRAPRGGRDGGYQRGSGRGYKRGSYNNRVWKVNDGSLSDSSSAGGTKKSKNVRKCFICNDEDHYAENCELKLYLEQAKELKKLKEVGQK